MGDSVLILGGGASGLMAGVSLARRGYRVTLLEKGARVGRKLAATGNGRCNLTNLHARAEDYGDAADFVRPALDAFPPPVVLEAFEAMGVVCAPDEAGRVYPMSNQASSVLDALRASLAEAGGVERTDFCAERIVQRDGQWNVMASDGRAMRAPALLCAMGGQAAPNLGGCADGVRLLASVGHRARPCHPALTPLKVDMLRLKALKGIRAAGSVALRIDGRDVAEESGEILFQDYGLSGIAAMQLSGAAAQALASGRRANVRLNLCGLSRGEAAARLDARRDMLPARPLENFLTGWLPKRLGQTLLKEAGCADLTAPSGRLSGAQLGRLAELMTGWTLPVSGVMGFAHAQVTRGGADRRDFDAARMASRLHRGLFAVGEVLDVDGLCGGYNLQWAWASALLAARAIDEYLRRP